LNILFHVGSGKTATSWLQDKFSRLPNTVFIGKDPWNKNFSEDPYTIHRDIFQNLYGDKIYQSINTTKKIQRYARLIAKVVSKTSGVNNILLSDENIGNYGNYNAELNIALLAFLKDAIEKEISLRSKVSESLNPILLFTFREQVSFLQSHYSFVYPLLPKSQRKLDDFLEKGLEDDHTGVFGTLWYDELYSFYSSVLKGWSINFIPYETIELKGEVQYLTACCTGLSFNQVELEKLLLTITAERKPINTNKGLKEGSNSLRKPDFISEVYLSLGSIAILRKILKPFKGLIHYFMPSYQTVGKGVETVDHGTSEFKPKIFQSSIDIEISVHYRKLWQNRLARSNRLLADITGHPLDKMGYLCESDNNKKPRE